MSKLQLRILLIIFVVGLFFLSRNLGSATNKNDSDNDGLTNDQELIMGTDPELADSDGDAFLDGAEVRSGFNPLGPGRLTEANALTKNYLLDKNSLINQGWLDYKIKQKAIKLADQNWQYSSQILNATSSPQLNIKVVNTTLAAQYYQTLILPFTKSTNCKSQTNTWGDKSITFSCTSTKGSYLKNAYSFYYYQDYVISLDNLDQGFTNRSLAWPILTLIDNHLKNNGPETKIVDFDNDKLSDAQELSLGTDPKLADTDGDGHTDYEEITSGYNPLGLGLLNNIDPDHDMLTNDQELIFGTDPWNKDTDGDGFSDLNEIKAGFNPLGQGKIVN